MHIQHFALNNHEQSTFFNDINVVGLGLTSLVEENKRMVL